MHPHDDQVYGREAGSNIWRPFPKEVADAQRQAEILDRADKFQRTLDEIRALPEKEEHGHHH